MQPKGAVTLMKFGVHFAFKKGLFFIVSIYDNSHRSVSNQARYKLAIQRNKFAITNYKVRIVRLAIHFQLRENENCELTFPPVRVRTGLAIASLAYITILRRTFFK